MKSRSLLVNDLSSEVRVILYANAKLTRKAEERSDRASLR